jgi:hypothetical protein
MKRKLLIILLFVVAVTIITVFTATKIMAFSDEACYGLNYDYCAEPVTTQTVTMGSNSWTISLGSNFEPIVIGDKTYYKWTYTFTGPTGGISGSNFIAMLIPYCCKETDRIVLIKEQSSPTNLDYRDVGSGETTLKFGIYNMQARVLKGTPDANNQWKLVTTTQYKTRSTIIIKYGNNVFKFEMAVPGCPLAKSPPPIGGRTYTECVNIGQETASGDIPGFPGIPATNDDMSFYIVRNMDREGCMSEVWGCIGHDCKDCQAGSCVENGTAQCQKMVWETLPEKTIIEGSLLRTCPDENFSMETGSPFQLITINSGGYTTKKCLDLNNGSWVNRCCCAGTCTCP